MAKKKRIRDWAEPWELAKSNAWRDTYKSPPKMAESPEELRIAVADWEAARARAEKNADVMILGSRLAEPEVLTSMLGTPTYVDDRRIIAFARLLGLPEGSPTHEEFAGRVVECVNGFCGVADPVEFMRELTAFLTDMAKDPLDQFFHGRATRLLFQIAEHKELVQARETEDEYVE